jgi:uncharacterized Tic20 family protein
VKSPARGSNLVLSPDDGATQFHFSPDTNHHWGEQRMSDVTDDQKNMAMLAHVLGIFTGFVAALVIWLMNKDKPDQAFVNDQAKEALNFQITMAIGWVATSMLMFVLIGIFLVPVLLIANLILCIMAGMKAKEGVEYRYPFALRLIK